MKTHMLKGRPPILYYLSFQIWPSMGTYCYQIWSWRHIIYNSNVLCLNTSDNDIFMFLKLKLRTCSISIIPKCYERLYIKWYLWYGSFLIYEPTYYLITGNFTYSWLTETMILKSFSWTKKGETAKPNIQLSAKFDNDYQQVVVFVINISSFNISL